MILNVLRCSYAFYLLRIRRYLVKQRMRAFHTRFFVVVRFTCDIEHMRPFHTQGFFVRGDIFYFFFFSLNSWKRSFDQTWLQCIKMTLFHSLHVSKAHFKSCEPKLTQAHVVWEFFSRDILLSFCDSLPLFHARTATAPQAQSLLHWLQFLSSHQKNIIYEQLI